MILPAKSSTRRTGDSSGTASTHSAGFPLAREYSSSQILNGVLKHTLRPCLLLRRLALIVRDLAHRPVQLVTLGVLEMMLDELLGILQVRSLLNNVLVPKHLQHRFVDWERVTVKGE